MEYMELNLLGKYIKKKKKKKIRSSEDSILTSSCTELKFFPVSIVKEKRVEDENFLRTSAYSN